MEMVKSTIFAGWQELWKSGLKYVNYILINVNYATDCKGEVKIIKKKLLRRIIIIWKHCDE